MNTRLMAAAETTKLARLLNVNRAEIDFLDDLNSDALAQFREQVTEQMFRGSAKLGRLAAASALLPVQVSATIAKLALGPVLAGALAGAMDPRRGGAVARQLPTGFLTEAAVALDPRRAAGLLAELPPDVIADVAAELNGRGDHVTMGRFVGVLSEPALRAAVERMSDEDLLRVGFVLEDKSGIDTLVEIVEDRLGGMVRAAHENDLWGEGIDLFSTVDEPHRAQIGEITADQGDAVLDGLVHAATRLRAWDALLGVTRSMSERSLQAFVNRPPLQQEETLAMIVDVAARHALWDALAPLAVGLPAGARAQAANRIGVLGDEQLAEMLDQVGSADQWTDLLTLVSAMEPAQRARVLAVVDAAPDRGRRLTSLTSATPDEVWDRLEDLVDEMPSSLADALAQHARRCGNDRAASAFSDRAAALG